MYNGVVTPLMTTHCLDVYSNLHYNAKIFTMFRMLKTHTDYFNALAGRQIFRAVKVSDLDRKRVIH